jgi:non-lysosomal glucosylceramidase
VELCWNGDYFQQNLPDYQQRTGEYGPGCLSDQLIGQWWAHILGLGYLLPQEHIQKALRTIFDQNWLSDMSQFRHSQRQFAGGTDKGLLICTWPRGGRPANPIPYVDEVWTGVEYEVAGLMIYEGMIVEALSIAKGARDRYDGIPRPPMPRNPWDELECGGHYARAMSSWALLLALSGFRYDGPSRALRFQPAVTPERFQSFFTGPEAWGSLSQERAGAVQIVEIQVVEGHLPVDSLRLAAPAGFRSAAAVVDGNPVVVRVEQPAPEAAEPVGAILIHLPEGTNVRRTLSVRLSARA